MSKPLHQGCYVCKTTAVPVLVSIPTPPSLTLSGGGYSIAVCPACAAKYER